MYADEQVAASLHTVLEPFLLRRVKTEVCTYNYTGYLFQLIHTTFTEVHIPKIPVKLAKYTGRVDIYKYATTVN